MNLDDYELVPVWKTYVETLQQGRQHVITDEPTSHHVASLHGTSGYYERDEPFAYILKPKAPDQQ